MKLAILASSILCLSHSSIDSNKLLALDLSKGTQSSREFLMISGRRDQREFSLDLCEDILELVSEVIESDSKVEILIF